MIIDAHAHIFQHVSGIYKGLPLHGAGLGAAVAGDERIQLLPPSHERSDSAYEVLLRYMDWQGVDKAILLPNALYGYHNDYVIEAVRMHPERFRGVALVDIFKGSQAVSELATLHAKGLFGLKIEVCSAFSGNETTPLDGDPLIPVWEYCDNTRQFVFLHIYRKNDFSALVRLCKRYRGISFIVCHLGAEAILGDVKQRDDIFNSFLDFLLDHSSVTVDISAVCCQFPQEEYPFATANTYIRRAYETIGSKRILWGSDYPGILTKKTYLQSIDQFRKHFTDLPLSDMASILGGNAQRMFFD
ncbi:MAG: amidohydrolase [Oscillospiraceae bacterium]|nr:amidohydrolase [Oscillospiraceae bacterium]